jgi:hypothetical protein
MHILLVVDKIKMFLALETPAKQTLANAPGPWARNPTKLPSIPHVTCYLGE